MRVVVIGDVGVVDEMVHLGDEAMFDALVEALRARGATSIVGVSNAPAETAERYGVEAVGRIGFSGARAEMQARFDRVLRCSAGERALPADDPAWTVIEAVSGADAVAIAGGGNLASTWPMHVFERAALGGIAERAGRPLVVTGQTFGPRLDRADRELVASLLRSAQLVGVREHASADLARRLGVAADRLAANRDDASFLGADHETKPHDVARWPSGMLLMSLSVHLGGLPRVPTVAGLAGALDRLAGRSGLPVVFHPHFGSIDSGRRRGDEVLHDEVRGRMASDAELLRVGTPRAAAALARSASMLVTSRYHPAVFAGPTGVPTAALAADDYTAVKLRGATGWWEQRGVLDLAEAASPVGGSVLARAWDGRREDRAAAARLRGGAELAASAWFDRIARALGGETG